MLQDHEGQKYCLRREDPTSIKYPEVHKTVKSIEVKTKRIRMVNNKQLMQTAPTMHCTPLFYISPYSMYLVGSAIVEHDVVLQPDDDGEYKKSLCAR